MQPLKNIYENNAILENLMGSLGITMKKHKEITTNARRLCAT